MSKRLDSWKEICAYLGRDRRTLGRWERERGLPVHRLPGGSKPRVFALAAEIDRWMDEGTPGAGLASAAAIPAAASVAVLPFVDLSPAGDQEHLCDGLVEEIITALARLEGLKVPARTSSFAFKGKLEDVRAIGRRLGVATVLEGSLRKAGKRLRIAVQLIDVADGCHIWSERLDREVDDLFAIQDEIAMGVVDRLKLELLAAGSGAPAGRHHPTHEAYDLYLRGRYFFNRRDPADTQRAIECYERAIAVDPEYARPYMGIAGIFVFLGLWGFLPPRQAWGRAKEAAQCAVDREGSLGEAHLDLAACSIFGEWDWAGARTHIECAEGSAPAAGMGPFVLAVSRLAEGRPQDALQLLDSILEDEPFSPIAYSLAAAFRVGAGEMAEAAALAEKALELDEAMLVAKYWLGCCRGILGQPEAAAELLGEVVRKGWIAGSAFLPAVLVRAGREAEARNTAEAFEKLAAERYASPAMRAFAWAGAGEETRARLLLAEAEVERSPFFTMALLEPGYLALLPAWIQAWFEQRRRQLLPRAFPGGPLSPSKGREARG